MPYSYSALLGTDSSLIDSWQDYYDRDLTLADNLLRLLQTFVVLPKDYYDIIVAYFLIPSALALRVPYLFLCGQSGSGKTTIGKLAAKVHGVPINTSSDTFAGIRNSLKERKYQQLEIPSQEPHLPSLWKTEETNTIMVWDDVDPNTFHLKPDLYRLFKFGYDRSTDRIVISSDKAGENLSFRCFCPKIFSSVSAIHLDDSLKELRRRLIVIPCQRLNTNGHLLDIDSINWKGFSSLFADYWNLELAELYLITRNTLAKSNLGLTANQRAISLDLLATGITTGIWQDETVGIAKLKEYFEWLESEVDQYSGISKHLADYIQLEQNNADASNLPLRIATIDLRRQVQFWLEQGWILEKPRPKQMQALLAELGLVLRQGYWVLRH